MSFNIQTKRESNCKKHKFCIYHHELSMDELDNYIIQIMFDEIKLHQLFEPHSEFNSKKRINQLRRFIEVDFKNIEDIITDEDIIHRISKNINPTYFSFFAEALLARLNIDYLDNKLVTGVISINETIKDGKTGTDVCMFSDTSLVIGEAKFYKTLSGGFNSISNDSSFLSKLESYCNIIISSEIEIILKEIDGDVREKSANEIKKIPFFFTGFVLHTKNNNDNYDTYYDKINEIVVENMPNDFHIIIYHLPVKSKEELIFKIQRNAVNLIVDLKTSN